jgi:hypothetical protein
VVAAWEAGSSQAVVVSDFTRAASITASLLAVVSFTIDASSRGAGSGSSGLASLIHTHILILIPIIAIQAPIGAIKASRFTSSLDLTILIVIVPLILDTELNGAKIRNAWIFSPGTEWHEKFSPGFQPINANLSKASAVECILSRRDSTIVARHFVPGSGVWTFFKTSSGSINRFFYES